MTSITAITISVWIQPPVRGRRGLILAPKKPSSHSMTKITMIVHNIDMRVLLSNDLLKATWSVSQITK